MKEVGVCRNCGRKVYTNDLDLCKRCYNEVGVEFLKKEVIEEPEEEKPIALEDLGIEEGKKEEEKEDSEEEKEDSKEEKSEEKKE